MSREPSNVRITDLKRGLKGLEKAGAKVRRVEIEGKKIIYVLDGDTTDDPGKEKEIVL